MKEGEWVAFRYKGGKFTGYITKVSYPNTAVTSYHIQVVSGTKELDDCEAGMSVLVSADSLTIKSIEEAEEYDVDELARLVDLALDLGNYRLFRYYSGLLITLKEMKGAGV